MLRFAHKSVESKISDMSIDGTLRKSQYGVVSPHKCLGVISRKP